ncbi:MAG: Lsa family ABC-F type ribosomal protection protein, partial [Bacilli bacterium]
LIARSLSEEAHLYVWDEPLNYIDIFSRIQIENLLSASGATVIFVEHDAEFVDKIATKTIHLQ